MIIFESLLTTFESSIIFRAGCGVVAKIVLSLNPNYHNQVLPILACPNPWYTLYCRRSRAVFWRIGSTFVTSSNDMLKIMMVSLSKIKQWKPIEKGRKEVKNQMTSTFFSPGSNVCFYFMAYPPFSEVLKLGSGVQKVVSYFLVGKSSFGSLDFEVFFEA